MFLDSDISHEILLDVLQEGGGGRAQKNFTLAILRTKSMSESSLILVVFLSADSVLINHFSSLKDIIAFKSVKNAS